MYTASHVTAHLSSLLFAGLSHVPLSLSCERYSQKILVHLKPEQPRTTISKLCIDILGECACVYIHHFTGQSFCQILAEITVVLRPGTCSYTVAPDWAAFRAKSGKTSPVFWCQVQIGNKKIDAGLDELKQRITSRPANVTRDMLPKCLAWASLQTWRVPCHRRWTHWTRMKSIPQLTYDVQ